MNASLLTHYDINNQCLLKTDASDIIITVIFSQKEFDGE